MLIIDTREKKIEHITSYFDKHGIEYRFDTMHTADYKIEGKDKLRIDRKQNLDELARNLMNRKDHSRFWKEVRRARVQNIKLIILCEHGGKIKSIQDIAQWHSKYSPVSGRALMDEIYRTHIAYGVEFLFCSKRSTGRRIIEILSQ